MNTSEPDNNSTPLEIDLIRAVAYETSLSLRFFAHVLIPEEITAALGIQPHISHLAGISLAPSDPVPSPFGMWVYWASQSSTSRLEDNMLQFLDQLPQDLSIWRSLTDKYSGVLVCSLRFDQYHSRQVFSAATLKKIAERGLSLNLDFKFDGTPV